MLRSLGFFLFSAYTIASATPLPASRLSTKLSQSGISQWHYRRGSATYTTSCYGITHLDLNEPIIPGQVGSTTYNARLLGAGNSGCAYGLSEAGSDNILAVAKYQPHGPIGRGELNSLQKIHQYYGEFKVHGQHIVVMKYVNGVPIDETDGYKESCGPAKTSDSDCLDFLAAAAGKVNEAHADVIQKYGIVHTDIVANNALFAKSFTGKGNNNEAPELIDWGSTHHLTPEEVEQAGGSKALATRVAVDFDHLTEPNEKSITRILPVPELGAPIGQGASGNDLPRVEPTEPMSHPGAWARV